MTKPLTLEQKKKNAKARAAADNSSTPKAGQKAYAAEAGKLKKVLDKVTGAKAGTDKQPALIPTPSGRFEQRTIDGKEVLKETVSKDIQDAADYWFLKKIEEGRAKDSAKKGGEKLLQAMEFEDKTSVLVFNSELQRKVRVQILQGAEKLRVEKNVTE